jgi:hypothetical protein
MIVSNAQQDGRADFDFEIGRWKVQSRRLGEWLKGSTAAAFSGWTSPPLRTDGSKRSQRMEAAPGRRTGFRNTADCKSRSRLPRFF